MNVHIRVNRASNINKEKCKIPESNINKEKCKIPETHTIKTDKII
jgi:hypothetical protein